MEREELQKAGRDLVYTYKASGLSMSDIASVLVYALEAVVRDPETSEEAINLLSGRPQNQPL